jgi:hypothetical protein
MDIRKIAVAGGFAVGAALAFAPLASATPTDPLLPFVDSEVSAMNALFVTEATLAGIPSSDYAPGPQGFDVILPAHIATDAPSSGTPSILDFELFGVNPFAAGVASDPGAFSEFNGALVNFDDAYNVALFELFNPGAPVTDIPLSDLFGSSSSITEALNTSAAMGGPIGDFLTDGWNDLLGYFGIFSA